MSESESFLNGWLAHKNDVGLDECPYDERTQAVSYGQWAAGWSQRFSACKHDLDMSLDEIASNAQWS